MGFPSLGALLQVGVPALGGHLAGANQGLLLRRKLEQEDEERQREQQMQVLREGLLRAQIGQINEPGAWAPQSKAEYLEVHPPDAPKRTIAEELDKYTREKQIDRQYRSPTEGSDRRPQWQKDGYPSLEEWRKDKAGGRADPMEAYRTKRMAELVTPKENYDSFNQKYVTGPAMSPEDAATQIDQEIAAMSGTGTQGPVNPQKTIADYISGRKGIQAGTAPTAPTAPGMPVVAPAEVAAPSGSPADRWEELVKGGMPEAEATAKVKAEFKLP